ncbi:hypothetical protein [Brevibacterium antiquum]|uniref:Uncharacterized protein n=1 Tax=Brevibacterium antiquum TaxID=234835 RepID=A0A2H1INW5_9MICO|nr:hypothetical protein [Brevibacterium antiquum]SMX76652.1 hypothetical protein BANT10_01117 [Brevibacterium antiquum]
MSEYTANLATIESAYVNWALLADRGIDASEAAAEFDRFIAKVKADALREAVEEFEGHVGAGEFDEQTRRNGTHWTHAVESWDHQGPFMYWLLNRADQIEREA